jgi:hypothetical protein
MFPWNKLPHDLRYLILKTFCSDLAHDYMGAYLGYQKSVTDKLACFDFDVSDLALTTHPAAAASFRPFLSAIQTSREFNHIILCSIQLAGAPVRLYLQYLQLTILSTLVQISREKGHRCQSLGRLLDSIRIGIGNFWRNPLLTQDEDLIPSVLYWSCQQTSDYLPHLEPWLRRHAYWDDQDQGNRRVNAIFYHPEYRKLASNAFHRSLERGETAQDPHEVLEQVMVDTVALGLEWVRFDAPLIVGYYSVKFLDQKAGTVDDFAIDSEAESSSTRQLLLQEDLRRFGLNSEQEAHMDLWWYFPEMSIQNEDEVPTINSGTFINFREKRMYTYSSPEIAIVWDNPYDKRTWKTLSTIEEIEEYRSKEVDWWSDWRD